jgi:hypothetical protein
MTRLRLFVLIGLISASAMWLHGAVQAAAESEVARGELLTSAEGSRLGQIYRVNADGSVQVMEGRLVTIPASTLSAQNGRVITSLKKPEVLALKR